MKPTRFERALPCRHFGAMLPGNLVMSYIWWEPIPTSEHGFIIREATNHVRMTAEICHPGPTRLKSTETWPGITEFEAIRTFHRDIPSFASLQIFAFIRVISVTSLVHHGDGSELGQSIPSYYD
jgi:hypothetical protein